MGVSDGQYANENTFNAAFMARNTDTDTSGKVSLLNAGSDNIDDAQKFINQLADTSGETENDPDRKNYTPNNYIADGDSRKAAIQKLDAKAKDLQDQVDVHESRLDGHDADLADHESRITQNESDIATHETRLDNHDTELADHESRLDTIESAPSSFSGDKTFNDDVVIQGDLTVNGTTTTVNSTVTEIADPTITLNNGGNDASSEGSGIEVERTTTNAKVVFDSTLASKWKVGLVGSLYEVIVSGVAQVISGLKDFVNGIKTDTIDEHTAAAGVTIDGVLVKDGLVDGRDVSVDGTVQDAHIANTSIHFTEASINHLNIQNIGTNSHAQIDTHIANTSNPHAVTKTQVGLGNVTDDAQLKRAAGDFNTFTEKLTVAADDLILIEDSADSFNKKKVKKSNLGTGGSGTVREHVFKLNGRFNTITLPALAQDTLYRFDIACKITNVIFVRETAGSSGTTEIDIKVKPPAGAFGTIFSTTPKIQAAAGSEVGVGVGEVVPNTTAPVLSSSPFNVAAGTLMKMDIITAEAGTPNSLSVIVIFEPQ